MADELEILLHYEPNPNIKICPRCEVENPIDGKICFLCGTDLSRVIKSEPVIARPIEPPPEVKKDVSFNWRDESEPVTLPKETNIGKTMIGVVVLVVLVILGLILLNSVTNGGILKVVDNNEYKVEQIVEMREEYDL